MPSSKGKKNTWRSVSSKWVVAMEAIDSGESAVAPHPIFAKGNSKLPFAAFSALPKHTCPGAGDCLKWCYSFRAWRYPSAFFRQLSNTLLMRFRRDIVTDAFNALDNMEVRLYVDGDFASTNEVQYWIGLIAAKPTLTVYGYSKSWAQLLEYGLNGGSWPTNYTLNVSSGSKWENNAQYARAIASLPITRGEFVAVPIDGDGIPKGAKRYDSPLYHARVREAMRVKYGKRVVSCPGKCGECGVAGKQWCGDKDKMNLVTIGIGIH